MNEDAIGKSNVINFTNFDNFTNFVNFYNFDNFTIFINFINFEKEKSRQPYDMAVYHIYILGLWHLGESWHAHHLACNGHNHL